MAIPARLLVQTVTRVRPAVSAEATYGNPTYDYGAGATRTTGIRAWLQQNDASETFGDGRQLLAQQWLMMTNEPGWDALDRVEWSGHPSGSMVTFSIDGVPEPAYTPRGFDHIEANLTIVEG